MIIPDFFYDSVFCIQYEQLLKRGIRGLVFDIDNTLAGHGDLHPPVKTAALVRRLQRMGFKVALLSNNSRKRVAMFNESMKLPVAHMALKPFPFALRRLIRRMGMSPAETAIVGDQLFTDIWCGKYAGCTTVLVKPLTRYDVISVRIKRGLESYLLKKYESRIIRQI